MEALLARRVRVRGTVQGVGFRPFVYKLAGRLAITGDVSNDGEGVIINAWGRAPALDQFVEAIKNCNLPLARVLAVEQSELVASPAPESFRIDTSHSGAAKTGVPPDACSCSECLREIQDKSDRRYRYPFSNCTHCGPRLSIIRSIPYDRAATSMSVFPMCKQCLLEYENPGDRRFHAQPNACGDCGPQLSFAFVKDGKMQLSCEGDPLFCAADAIRQGLILALKGLGGFHLVCDALNEGAVSRLRERKRRFDKPFALMAPGLKVIGEYCHISPAEEELLCSAAAPIVLLKRRTDSDASLPTAIAPGQTALGFMLPYTPLHFLLLEELAAPVICTSGNISDEPQCISNEQAEERLGRIADCFLLHNREIVNRVDDSVLRSCLGEMRILRRARGFAPEAIPLPEGFVLSESILAMGGQLKNTFCLIKDNQAVVSQHIGDLEDARTFLDYKKNLDLYRKLFRFEEQLIVVDSHEEYVSSKLGKAICQEKEIELLAVQHHHAHIAACMGEHRIGLNSAPVLGVALDGLGMGLHGEIWGGEFFIAHYTRFKRLASLRPAALIGGAQAMREPWRNLYAQISQSIGFAEFCSEYDKLELADFLKTKPLSVMDGMLASATNVPMASSCGRLFDAVAVALGICRERVSYEGQAAIELETLAQRAISDYPGESGFYDFQILRQSPDSLTMLDPTPMWKQLFADMTDSVPAGTIARRFHEGLSRAVVELCRSLLDSAETNDIDTIALSGGVFQNKLILESVGTKLQKCSYRVLAPRLFPANDGGLSFGQALICAALVASRGVPENVSGDTGKNCRN